VADTDESTVDLHRYVGLLLQRMVHELAVLEGVRVQVAVLIAHMQEQHSHLEVLQAMLESQIRGRT